MAPRTCSFLSVSCFKDAERESRVSPWAAFDAGGPLVGLRRGADVLSEEGTRGVAAERAVAPRAIEGEEW